MNDNTANPTAGNRRICFIHIGTPKTGSTSLQAFLGQNRAKFSAAGVCVPESAGPGEPDFGAHHAVVGDLLGEPAAATGGLATVRAELAAATAQHACLSSENFSLLYDRPDLLGRLREAVVACGFTPVIIAFLRPQASYAVAIFAHNARSGYRVPFDDFFDEVITDGAYRWLAGYGPQFDYVKLLDGFADVFTPQAVIARRFSSDAPDTALLRAFCDIVAPQVPFERFTIPARRANRTPTFAAVLRLLGTPNDFDERVRFAPFDVRDIARCQNRFSPANERLRARYGIALPVVEPLDVIRALPLRRSLRLARQCIQARRVLRPRSGSQRGVLSNQR